MALLLAGVVGRYKNIFNVGEPPTSLLFYIVPFLLEFYPI